MSNLLVASFQRPQNESVLTQLIAHAGCDVAVRPETLTPTLREAAATRNTRVLAIDTASAVQTQQKASNRHDRIADHLSAVVEANQHLRALAPAVVETVLRGLRDRLAGGMQLIDTLDDLRDSHPNMALLVNETDLPVSRIAALWARRHGVPSFLVSGRTNLGDPTTVTRKMLADYVFVFGERGAAPYLDMGVPLERIVVTGNPAWDHYGAVLANRGRYRSQTFASLGLRGGAPLIMFATTWNARLSALGRDSIYERTARAFLRACKRLGERGVAFNAVIKDMPSKAREGRAMISRIAAEEAYENYTFAEGDIAVYLCAADVLVGFEASVFVEAMMAAVPALNIWCEETWLMGPVMNYYDGVPSVAFDDPAGLAEKLHSLLTQPASKLRVIEKQKKRFWQFHITPDGHSAERCAQEILKRTGSRTHERSL